MRSPRRSLKWDYSYYDDEGTGSNFEQDNVKYLSGEILQDNVKYLSGPQKLLIGRFTSIGPGTTNMMPGGNHPWLAPPPSHLQSSAALGQIRLLMFSCRSNSPAIRLVATMCGSGER